MILMRMCFSCHSWCENVCNYMYRWGKSLKKYLVKSLKNVFLSDLYDLINDF